MSFAHRTGFQSTLPVWGATFKFAFIDASAIFQSTLPVWGATSAGRGAVAKGQHFNPRSPCGERLADLFVQRFCDYISIHAPRVGSDVSRPPALPSLKNFNPRSPCGERPTAVKTKQHIYAISIHAPRVGSDVCSGCKSYTTANFNPRSPCGERPKWFYYHYRKKYYFNPRSPCGERHIGQIKEVFRFFYFNPRSPCGERLQKQRKNFVFLPKTDTKFPYLLRFYSKKLNLQEKERKFQQNNGAKLLNDL